jgi:iron complex transport system substrate-binding protein
MRICSLLPSATEIVFALGLGDHLIGVSHACDFPREARKRPVLTRSLRGRERATHDIPVHGVSMAGVASTPSYALDGDLLRALEPDLILTQDICDVCAIGSNTVFEVTARVLGYAPEFLTIRAAGLEDILQNILATGSAAGAEEPADRYVEGLRARIETARAAAAGAGQPKRVLGLEWARPLMVAGLWIPELVEIADGAHGLTGPGECSRRVGWDEIVDFAPQAVLFMPCGYDMARARAELTSVEAAPEWATMPASRAGEVYMFDGRVPSRYGPRIVDVLEAFAEILHPRRFAPRWRGTLYEAVG